VHPAGSLVAAPKSSPGGAVSVILVKSTCFSLAADSVKNTGLPVGTLPGLISSWAHAGAAAARLSTATERKTRRFMSLLGVEPEVEGDHPRGGRRRDREDIAAPARERGVAHEVPR